MEQNMTTMDLLEQHLLAAFQSMEPPQHLLTLARKCGGGSITQDVQHFIWLHCINKPVSTILVSRTLSFGNNLFVSRTSVPYPASPCGT
ncbi:hypothetical protein KSS87_012907 [Heliosperma pusillum]|nr:hypothetical protein KSS87_012907 [Heliosperma pusillum]